MTHLFEKATIRVRLLRQRSPRQQRQITPSAPPRRRRPKASSICPRTPPQQPASRRSTCSCRRHKRIFCRHPFWPAEL
ncbi:unnamed protein product [Protopolystoma xenopodis]|uniref:Uncharacterized protein n=1 Tax=Protopolystoma xenopodis TaxID=117903 RepID=A0A448WT09_9PLAT|nr:unnamed protein product [Protopolystoma xenopodis]